MTNALMPVQVPRHVPYVDTIVDAGCKGDGIVDDTVAAQKALDLAGDYGWVIFPAGKTFLISSMLVPHNHQTIMMYGAQFNFTGSASMVAVFFHQNTVSSPSVKRAITGTWFLGGTFTESGGGQGASAIQLGVVSDSGTFSSKCKAFQVEAVGCNIDFQGQSDNEAFDCFVHDSTQTNAPAIRLAAPSNGDNSLTYGHYKAHHNTVVTYGSIGVSAVGYACEVDDNILIDCGLGTLAFAIDCGNAQQLQVHDNHIRSYWGILSENAVGETTVEIHNNKCWFDGTISGGQIANAMIEVHRTNLSLTILATVKVHNNTIDGGANGCYQGILFEDVGAIFCHNNNITNTQQNPITIHANIAGGGVDAKPCDVYQNSLTNWGVGTPGLNAIGIQNQSKNFHAWQNTISGPGANGSIGINCTANATGSTVRIENDNNISGCHIGIGDQTGNVVKYNYGEADVITEASGTATVTGGSGTATVTHGLRAAPLRVFITPTDSTPILGGVTGKDATDFEINAVSATDCHFDWYARTWDG